VRRAVFAILGTAAATSLLVAVKANVDAPPQDTAAQSPPGSAPPSGPAGGGAGGSAGPTGAPAAGPGNGEFDGKTIQTPYGPVAVTITMSGGRITAIDALVPSSGESADIGPPAAKKLREQALVRQNAKLDTVSGATYTSEAYKKSLQSALDLAKRG
jgi:uncharacterized protein with FMN-binding domain